MQSTFSFEPDIGDTNLYRPGCGPSFISHGLMRMLLTLFRMEAPLCARSLETPGSVRFSSWNRRGDKIFR
jgi:hypothetical protein